MSTGEAGHPAWCDPQHCYVTDEEVRVPEQAPACAEEDTAGLRVRFESRFLDPGDDDTAYLDCGLTGPSRLGGVRAPVAA
ncbi:MAG TPA: hypothetical protein VK887_03545 [Pseudonocardiaceae bacterium]|nr:hypothetical protein [Pseudonocardiaceae bacterium]